MLELGQFDLKLAFGTAGATGENIQDEAHTVDNPALKAALEIALLSRRQFMVENDDLGPGCRHPGGDLICLTAPHKQRGVWPCALADHLAQHLQPGPAGQQAQLGEALLKIRAAEIDRHEHDALAPLMTLKHEYGVLN